MAEMAEVEITLLLKAVATLQRDVSGITASLRALQAKVDRMDRDLTDMRERLEEIAGEVRQGFGQVAETQARMLDLLQSMTAKLPPD